MKKWKFIGLLFSLLLFRGAQAQVKSAQLSAITQYGITWTFDKAYTAGQYVTGDYWVLGPVKIIRVTPVPGPVTASGSSDAKSRYGAVAMHDDKRMRNGSMIVKKPSPSQGYDSRLINYQPELSVSYPLDLVPGSSLISTISNETFPVTVLQEAIMWDSEKKSALALKAAAILTCVDKLPAEDAFRPPYVGAASVAGYTLKDIKWDLLPSLKPAGAVPSWAQYERYFQRPWLDHIESWLLQETGPSENQVFYGREFSRLSSIASLMLMLDEPRKRKEKLMIGMIQWGIDLYGLAAEGRYWTADGGHWNGRKWPILFAGLLLGDTGMVAVPSRTLFSEDQQTYYGAGWCGQKALYQMCYHTGPQPPYEEKSPEQWLPIDKKSEGYRIVVSCGLVGTALAVQLMKAKALWDHDAFFDYYDRYMNPTDPCEGRRGPFARPAQEGQAQDPFVTAMWKAYRDKVPAQPAGKDNVRWVNEGSGGRGHFIPNPPMQ